MAILKNLQCTIQIAGRTAAEYGQEIDGNTVTNYIIAESGKEFAFDCSFSASTAERLSYDALADGQLRRCRTFQKPYPLVDSVSKTYTSVEGDQSRRLARKLMFGSIQTVDERIDDMETRMDILKGLGSLELRVWRCQKHAEMKPHKVTFDTPFSVATVHEKALKGRALDHRTMLGDAVEEPTKGASKAVRIDPKDKPFVTFVFKYRSPQGLRSEGIISEDQMLDAMTPEQLREELRGRNGQSRKRSREDDVGGEKNSNRKVKKEKLGKQQSTVIETIELSDDSD